MSMWILLPCHFRKLMVGLDSQSINTGLSFSLDCLHSSLRGLSGTVVLMCSVFLSETR